MDNVDFIRVVLMLLALGFSVMFHEIMHGWTALQFGDPTAKLDGRLTFNPIKHIDPWMTIVMPLIFWISTNGAFVLGGAKPVQINPLNFRNPGFGMMVSAAAGPLSNFFLAAVGYGLLVAFYHGAPNFLYDPATSRLTYNGLFLALFLLINLFLGAFNLIPIPPLDGSRILRYLLPREGKMILDRMEPFGFLILIPLLVLGLHRFFLVPFFVLLQSSLLAGTSQEFYRVFVSNLSR